jgi:DNA-binding LytR/AlgR family response regulator
VNLRYALIDDEPPARNLLRTLIQDLQPGARCLAEAADGIQGLALLKAHRPDLLFLDVEFPPDGAFGLLRRAKLEGLPLPPIVFVTAYDRYAVEAFRWSACDYLLKPIEPDLLREALGRVPDPHGLDLNGLLETLQALREPRMPERFTVQAKGRLRVLAWKDVSHLRTENRLLFVHTPEGRFVLDRSLDELEPLLTPEFIRPHRSALVALRDIHELAAEPGEAGELRLRDGSRIPVSRERLPEVRRRLGFP